MIRKILLNQPNQRQIEAIQKLKSLEIAGQIATRQLIKEEELTDEEKVALVAIFPRWQVGIKVKVGEIYNYHGILYEVVQAHTTQSDWTPDQTDSLFKSHAPAGIIPEWQQPQGSHDAYNTGDKVIYQSKIYESLIDGNVWSPSTYPQGWQEIEE